MGEIKIPDVKETTNSSLNNFKEIKPIGNFNINDAKELIDQKLDSLNDSSKMASYDNLDNFSMEKIVRDYINDVRDKSEFSNTIPDNPIKMDEIRKNEIDENAEKHEEFSKMKNDLKKSWKEKYGIEWPKYDKDLYITNKNGEKILLRKAGNDYDIHHILPICLGGKNEVENITPLSADAHRIVHATNSPCNKMIKKIDGGSL